MSAFARLALVSLTLALSACGPGKETKRWAADVTGGDPERGRAAIQHYGCLACHTIQGLGQSDALVGPPLTRMAGRSYLAGNMQNNAANLTHFIQHPRQVHNDTAMPEMNVTESDARDIAAFLYQFK